MDVSISKDSRFVSIWFLMFESIVFEGRFVIGSVCLDLFIQIQAAV